MSVATSISSIGYVGNNSTVTPYAVPFPFFVDSDLVVVKTDALGVDTILALSTDYTVAGVGGPSGTVTTLAAIDATHKVTIYRDVAATQPLQYEEADDFAAASHESGLDRATYLAQQNARKLAAAFRLRESDGATNAFAKVLSALIGIGPDGLAKMFTGADIQALLNLPATVIDQPTKTFLNAAARASATPDFIGQVGCQIDTATVYLGTSMVTGGWTLYDFSVAPGSVGTTQIANLAVTVGKLAAVLDLSGKTVILPNLSVTPAMLSATLDLSGKTLTLPAVAVQAHTPAGSVVQTQYVETKTRSTLSGSNFVADDTSPTISWGHLILSKAMACSSVSNNVTIQGTLHIADASANNFGFAVFADSTLIAVGWSQDSNGDPMTFCFQHSPSSTAAITYTVRCAATGNLNVNGAKYSYGPYLGTNAVTNMIIQEIKG